jgi:hypothetical protein
VAGGAYTWAVAASPLGSRGRTRVSTGGTE